MALIYFGNRFLTKFAPKFFKLADTNSEMILGTALKLGWEMSLLDCEMNFWSSTFLLGGTYLKQKHYNVDKYVNINKTYDNFKSLQKFILYGIIFSRFHYTLKRKNLHIVDMRYSSLNYN